jgi:hypothetical protein
MQDLEVPVVKNRLQTTRRVTCEGPDSDFETRQLPENASRSLRVVDLGGQSSGWGFGLRQKQDIDAMIPAEVSYRLAARHSTDVPEHQDGDETPDIECRYSTQGGTTFAAPDGNSALVRKGGFEPPCPKGGRF